MKFIIPPVSILNYNLSNQMISEIDNNLKIQLYYFDKSIKAACCSYRKYIQLRKKSKNIGFR